MSVVRRRSAVALLTKSLVNMRAQLGDLQRHSATGKKSADYAGLGLERGLTVGLRAHLSAIGGYNDTITNVTCASSLRNRLGRIADIGREVKSVTSQTTRAGPRPCGAGASSLGELLGLLNTPVGDRYIFSGLATDTARGRVAAHILDGDGARAGFRQLVTERIQADLGAGGLGRLIFRLPTATSVRWPKSRRPPFGFKLAGSPRP